MDHTVWLSRTQLDAITEAAWVLIAVAIGLVAHRVTYWLLSRWAERSHNWFAGSVVRRTCRPAAYVFPLLAILVPSSSSICRRRGRTPSCTRAVCSRSRASAGR